MKLKQVLQKCEEEGYPITRAGLYYAGKNYGFLISSEGNRKLEFDKDKFLEWLKRAKEEVPEGWVPIKDLPAILKMNIVYCYEYAKDERVGAKRIGAGRGVLYVDPQRVKEVIENDRNKDKINWDE